MKTATNKDMLAEKTIGYRTVMGTRWSRDVELRRFRRLDKIECYTVAIICNGAVDLCKTFKTRAAAEVFYGDLGADQS